MSGETKQKHTRVRGGKMIIDEEFGFTLEVMKSSLVSMSGVSRQARNLRDVRAVRSWSIPEEMTSCMFNYQYQLNLCVKDQNDSTGS